VLRTFLPASVSAPSLTRTSPAAAPVAAGEEATDGGCSRESPDGPSGTTRRLGSRQDCVSACVHSSYVKHGVSPEDNQAGQQHGTDRDPRREHANDSVHQDGAATVLAQAFESRLAAINETPANRDSIGQGTSPSGAADRNDVQAFENAA
jgi:hypothetical protein